MEPERRAVSRIDIKASFAHWVSGSMISNEDWTFRHKVVLWVLAVHVPILFLFGILGGDRTYAGATFTSYTAGHAALEAGIVGIFALAAAIPGFSRRIRSAVACVGLIAASAVLVHFSGGYIEAHFHFFVMVGLASIYNDWVPFVATVLFVVIHHGIVGTVEPESVFNHAAAFSYPWHWAVIHATFILFMAATQVSNMILIGKRLEERALKREERVAELI